MKLFILFLFMTFYSMGQTYLVNEQFSSSTPVGWSTTTPSGWSINNYGVGNARSGAYALRLSSASSGNGKYVYIPINVQTGYSYTITFWTKRICSTTINTNETLNQTTLLSTFTQTNSNCNSNWSTWYQWSNTYVSTYTGTMYFQIVANTVYGGPTSIYIDDVNIIETEPTSLPIELLYFRGKNDGETNILYWSTATEINNDYFTIEKSYDGYVFNIIDYIEGAGYSTHQLYYEYHDSNLQPFITYYKLKQTDYDGKYEYSEIISVDSRGKEKPTLIKIVNTLGQEVTADYNGLVIYIYSDGSVMKTNNQK
jgi:hypothetical protein